MRKMHAVLITSALALTGVNVWAFASNNNKDEIKEVEAARDDLVSSQDYYYIVDDLTKLYDGDTVILKNKDGNDTICDIGGNPGYMYTTSENVHRNHDDKVVWLDDVYCTTLTVEVIQENAQTYYAFKGTFWPNARTPKNNYKKTGYIAYDPTGRNSDYPGYPAFGGVGYFRDAFGVRPLSHINDDKTRNECLYTLTYNAETGMDIRNVAHNDLRIGFGQDRWAGYFTWNGWGDVNLYKKVTYTAVGPVDSGSVKKDYHQGDELDLSGLEFDVYGKDSHDNTITHTANYSLDDKAFFQHNKYVVGASGSNAQYISYMNRQAVIINVNVTSAEPKFYQVTRDLKDYRGIYVLGRQETNDEPYNGEALYFKTGAAPEYQTGVNHSAIVNGNNISMYGNNTSAPDSYFELVYENNAYRIKRSFDGVIKYLGYNTDEETSILTNVNFYSTTSIETALDVVFDNGGSYAFIKSKTAPSLYINEYGDLGDYGAKLKLYKQQLSNDDLDQVDSFRRAFIEITTVCDPAGGEGYSFGITESQWNSLISSYSAYSLSVKGYLGSVTYTHNEEVGGSIEDIIDRYDYIYTKYHSSYAWMADFLGRSGMMQDLQPQTNTISPIANLSGTNITVIVIVSISLVAISALAVVMVIKKKKTH